MSDLSKVLNTLASEEDWEAAAVHAGMPASEVKARIIEAIAALESADAKGDQAGSSLEDLVLGVAREKGHCITQPFGVSLFKIVGLEGKLTVCGTNSSNWTAKLQFCLVVAGVSVWCTSYQFDPHNLSVCYSPRIGIIAKAKLCFGVSLNSNKLCLKVQGDACYWRFGWHCGKFDQTLFCVPIRA